MEIETARLKLRRPRESDVHAMNAILADPRAMRFWSTPPHRSLEETRVWLQRIIDAPAEDDEFIFDLGGRVIGEAGVHLGEFGVLLHPDFWGRGLGYEASSAIIRHTFATRPLDRLTADVDPNNEGSIALLTKLGFRKTGEAERTFCIDGQWVDSHYFALERV